MPSGTGRSKAICPTVEQATCLKVPRGGRIVSVAVISAIGVNTVGLREVLGLELGTSAAEPI